MKMLHAVEVLLPLELSLLYITVVNYESLNQYGYKKCGTHCGCRYTKRLNF